MARDFNEVYTHCSQELVSRLLFSSTPRVKAGYCSSLQAKARTAERGNRLPNTSHSYPQHAIAGYQLEAIGKACGAVQYLVQPVDCRIFYRYITGNPGSLIKQDHCVTICATQPVRIILP